MARYLDKPKALLTEIEIGTESARQQQLDVQPLFSQFEHRSKQIVDAPISGSMLPK